MGASNSGDSILVFSARVKNVKVDWAGEGCSVDNASIKKILSKFASNLEGYVRSLGVLDNIHTIDRFDLDGSAWVEIRTIYFNKELNNVDGEIESCRKVIRQKLSVHREAVSACANEGIKQIKIEGNHAAVEALSKCLSSSEGLEIELDFKCAGQEIVKTTKSIPMKIISEDEEDVTGVVRQFDDAHEKVTLHFIEGLPGGVTLNVHDLDQRKVLIMAQLECRLITVKFLPSRNRTRPDKDAREGFLVEISSVGPTQATIQ